MLFGRDIPPSLSIFSLKVCQFYHSPVRSGRLSRKRGDGRVWFGASRFFVENLHEPLLVQVEAADIHGGHLIVSPLDGHSIWALQALAIRDGATGLYPLIGTPVALLVVLGRAGLNGNQALLGTTGVPLVTREPDGSSTVGLLTT